jgi:hypothetical protein
VDIDPSVDTTCSVAFAAPTATPVPGDFAAATWEHDPEKDMIYARRKMGGLSVGKYRMFVKITGSGVAPETPVLRTETLFEVV